MSHPAPGESGPVSVIVPAHDESANIGRCLQALAPQVQPLGLDVVVVANGCTDRTADIARSFAWSTVVELEEASKIAALNAGDRVAAGSPRVYLDADVQIDPEALRDVVRLVRLDEAVVCSPDVDYQVESCAWAVRAYYRVHAVLPSARQGIAGHGVYAVSATGRRRFGEFPPVQADDFFVARMFTEQERVRARGSILVWPPRDLRSLVAVRTRILRANKVTARAHADAHDSNEETTAQTVKALLRHVVRRPTSAPDAAVYVGVTLLARARARRSPEATSWSSDTTTRVAP